MHPLARYAVPAGIALIALGIAWFILSPVLGYLTMFWPILAFAAGIGLLLWRFPVAQLKGVIAGFHEIATTQPIFGIVVTLLFTGIYGFLLWLGYFYGADLLQRRIGISSREAWLLVTILGLPTVSALWRLYSATGIPGDAAVIGRGSKVLALFALAFFAYWYHIEPNRLFDPESGKALFLIAEGEGKPYFVEDITETKWTHSPVTGEVLRSGTPEDIERIQEDSWFERLQQFFDSPGQSWKQTVAPADYPDCPGHRSQVEISFENSDPMNSVKFPLGGEHCWAEKVLLPKPMYPPQYDLFFYAPYVAGVRFWDGDKLTRDDDRDAFMDVLNRGEGYGEVAHTALQLRGKGVATITIMKRTS